MDNDALGYQSGKEELAEDIRNIYLDISGPETALNLIKKLIEKVYSGDNPYSRTIIEIPTANEVKNNEN